MKYFYVCVCSALLAFQGYTQSRDLITIKKASVSPAPNYNKLKGGGAATKLIDGKLATTGLFWTNENTLGWQYKEQITLDIDLEKGYPISSVTISTAKNEAADIYFPLSVALFLSDDNKSFTYMGDLATFDAKEDGLFVKKVFKSGDLEVNARYVKIVVVPKGNMFFVDEVRVERGNTKNTLRDDMQISLDELPRFLQQVKRAAMDKSILIGKMDGKNNAKYNDLRKRLIAERQLDQTKLKSYEAELSALTVPVDKLGEGVLTDFLDDVWEGEQGNKKQLDVISPVGLSTYVGWKVKNNTKQKRNYVINVKGLNPITMELYEVQPVQTRKAKHVFDAMVPISNQYTFGLSPGEQRFFIADLRSKKEVNQKVEFFIDKGHSLFLNYRSKDIGIDHSFKESLGLHVNVWPYYNSKFAKGREKLIQKDLINHSVDVFVIPPAILESHNPNTDFKKVNDYLDRYNGTDKVLLFLNFNVFSKNKGEYLTNSWKVSFLKWYDGVSEVLSQKGIKPESIYFYPYDEVKQYELNDFVAFTDWIRGQRKGVQLYGTLFNEELLAEVDSQLDLIQILVNRNKIQTFPPNSNKYWLYDIMDDSKELSPTGRYRLMGWRAYLANAKGIGFWNYADQFGESIWDDADGQRPDYNVVYDRGTQLASSKRWEAFKQGVEEYYLLKKYEQQIGRKKTEDIVKKGIQGGNLDIFRNSMIRELLK